MAKPFILLVDSLNLTYPVKEIAVKTGYSKGNVSIFLSNKKQPTKAFLKKFYEVFNIKKGDREMQKCVPIKDELPEILGIHEIRLARLESFMKVTVQKIAELKAVNKTSGLKATEDAVLNNITTLKEEMFEFLKKHLLEAEGKLY